MLFENDRSFLHGELPELKLQIWLTISIFIEQGEGLLEFSDLFFVESTPYQVYKYRLIGVQASHYKANMTKRVAGSLNKFEISIALNSLQYVQVRTH